jgi:uncharacterized membrane protein
MTATPEHKTTEEQGSEADGKRKKTIVITAQDAQLLHNKLRLGQVLAIGSYIGLLVFFSLQNLLSETGNLKTWLVEIIPLIIFIPGLIKQTHRTYSWICFVTLMYFLAIIPLLMAHWRWSDWLVTLLVCTLFLSAMMTSRWLQYWRYYLSTQAP